MVSANYSTTLPHDKVSTTNETIGWEERFKAMLAPHGLQPFPPGDGHLGRQPRRGDLVVWAAEETRLAHVAVATGRMLGEGVDRSPEVYSFWPPPGHFHVAENGSRSTVDVLKMTSVKELTDYMVNPPTGSNADRLTSPVVSFGRGPW